ncbi:MAG: extracellular solute-binding protein, partial [Butyricicoccus sp.]|nr:extracellular solute-binding protein [Butyricicoccus sp.]
TPAPAADPAPADEPAPAEPAEGDLTASLTLATYPVGKMTDEAVIKDLIADFNAVYPNVSVNVVYLDYTNGDQTLNGMVEGGAAPDLIFEGPERLVAQWGAKGYLVDLKDIVPAGTYDVTVSSCTSAANGAVYELPVCQTAHCMGINYDLFEQAGALQYINEDTHTWKSTEDFLKAVEAVAAIHPQVGVVFCGGQGGDQGNRALVTNMYGGQYTNSDFTRYTANCAENVKALEALKNVKGIEFDPAIVGGDEISLFCNGTLAMATCWNVGAATSDTQGKTAAFKIFPMAFPTESGDPVLQGGIWGFGVFDNGDQNRIDAAKAFAKFMTEDDAQYKKIVQATNYWATRDIGEVYAGTENEAVMGEYGMLVPYMGPYYQITLGWAEARTAWWNELQNIGSGAKDVQTALDDFVATANAAAEAAEAG